MTAYVLRTLNRRFFPICRQLINTNRTSLAENTLTTLRVGNRLFTQSLKGRLLMPCSTYGAIRAQSSQSQQEQLIFDIRSEDDFDELVLNSSKPFSRGLVRNNVMPHATILVFWRANRCGPCQNLAPRLTAKVQGQQGKILLAKINVEDGTDSLTEQFDISSVPTVICFRHGDLVHRFEGDVDDSYLDELMGELMLKEEGLHKNPAGRIVPDEDTEKI